MMNTRIPIYLHHISITFICIDVCVLAPTLNPIVQGSRHSCQLYTFRKPDVKHLLEIVIEYGKMHKLIGTNRFQQNENYLCIYLFIRSLCSFHINERLFTESSFDQKHNYYYCQRIDFVGLIDELKAFGLLFSCDHCCFPIRYLTIDQI